MTTRVSRAADRPAQPWRNGGGLTREVARQPDPPAGDDFDWRVSLAEVATSGPFSAFTGVDRVIVLIEGNAMTLTVDGVVHELEPLQPFGFDGGATTWCHVPAGPTRDLNVMTRRGRVSATVEVLRLAGRTTLAPAEPLLVVVLSGALTAVADEVEVELGPLDALECTGPTPVELSGAGVAVAVTVAVTVAVRLSSDAARPRG